MAIQWRGHHIASYEVIQGIKGLVVTQINNLFSAAQYQPNSIYIIVERVNPGQPPEIRIEDTNLDPHNHYFDIGGGRRIIRFEHPDPSNLSIIRTEFGDNNDLFISRYAYYPYQMRNPFYQQAFRISLMQLC